VVTKPFTLHRRPAPESELILLKLVLFGSRLHAASPLPPWLLSTEPFISQTEVGDNFRDGATRHMSNKLHPNKLRTFVVPLGRQIHVVPKIVGKI